MASRSELLKHAASLRVEPPDERSARSEAKPTRGQEAARAFAVDCARLMRDDRCEETVVLDLRGVSPVCDFFVIATGTSDRQMRAVVDHIKEMGRERGETPYTTAGYEEGTWIVVDYVDVVVHLFDAEQRAYYDLDSLWGDSPHVEWEAEK